MSTHRLRGLKIWLLFAVVVGLAAQGLDLTTSQLANGAVSGTYFNPCPPKGGLLSRGFNPASYPTASLGSYHVSPTTTCLEIFVMRQK